MCFPDCSIVLTTLSSDGSALNIGEAAHIISSARQGPRGTERIDDAERDRRASNRVLLCPKHHTLVDKELAALRNWVQQAERDSGQRLGITTDERQRMKELEREVKELRRANEILKAASAFFARELDPRLPK